MWCREDLAWLAGFYEGEGSFSIRKPGSRRYVALSISSTDEDVLRRAHAILGLGLIYGPYLKPGLKPSWRWQVADSDDAVAVAVALYGWLGERRRAQIRAGIAAYVASAREVRADLEYRASHCQRGHRKDVLRPSGVWDCRRCRADQAREARRRRKEAA